MHQKLKNMLKGTLESLKDEQDIAAGYKKECERLKVRPEESQVWRDSQKKVRAMWDQLAELVQGVLCRVDAGSLPRAAEAVSSKIPLIILKRPLWKGCRLYGLYRCGSSPILLYIGVDQPSVIVSKLRPISHKIGHALVYQSDTGDFRFEQTIKELVEFLTEPTVVMTCGCKRAQETVDAICRETGQTNITAWQRGDHDMNGIVLEKLARFAVTRVFDLETNPPAWE